MNDKSRFGLEILQAAALIGVLGDGLLRTSPWGVNISFLLITLAAAYVMLIARQRRDLWKKSTLALTGALVFFALTFSWRVSEELNVYSVLAIFSILALMIVPSLGVKLPSAGVVHYVAGFVWSGINIAFGPLVLLVADIEWKAAPKSGWKSGAVAVVRGLLLATPLIVVFGALFMAADAVFQGIVERTFNIDPKTIFQHVLLTGFLSWITAGYLRGAMVDFTPDFKAAAGMTAIDLKTPAASVTEVSESPDEAPATPPAPERKQTFADFDNSVLPGMFTLGAIEISIILGLMNLLFLSFVILQIPYLFGGLELVQNTPDFKLADYARRGFGELVAVAALVLPILLGSSWLLRRDKPGNEKIFRILAGIQIALLFVIMASAAQRLFILTGNLGYGLTTLRFYPFVVMIWLAVVFLWFGATVLRGVRNSFAWGAFWSGLVILGALHFVNPDDYIVRTNLRLKAEGRAFDANYNSRLSDDAIPVLLQNLDRLDENERRIVSNAMKIRLCQLRGERDYRGLNLSRHYASRALEGNESISSLAGDCRPQPVVERDAAVLPDPAN